MAKNTFNLGFGFGGVHSVDETIALAKNSEAAGLSSVWIAEDYFQGGAFSIAAACACNTEKIDIGIGVINPFTRHPALIAMEVNSLDEISRGRAIVAMGASNKRWIELQAGIPYVKPITATKECTQIVKTLIRGEEAQYDGTVFKTGPIRLESKPYRANQPVYLGVKGDVGLQAAGEVADGVLLSAGSPVQYVYHAKEMIAIGAKRAGRNPEDIRIAVYLPAYVDPDGEKAFNAMRGITARYLGLHGDNNLTRCAGLSPEKTVPFREAFLAGKTCTDPVTDDMIDALTLCGTPEHCRARIQEYMDAGVDMPIIFEVMGVLTPAQSLDMIRTYLMD